MQLGQIILMNRVVIENEILQSWVHMTNLLKKFQSRIESGVQSDLLDLVRCQYLNSRRARAFYKAGFTSLSKLAKADLIDVIAILKARFKFILELIK